MSICRGNSDATHAERGQTAVMMLLFLTVCLCFMAVVIDGGMFFFERRDMQGTADAAALAAVRELPTSVTNATAAANSYVSEKNSLANGNLRSMVLSDANRRVQVTVGKAGTTNFGQLLGIDSPEIAASATARVQMMGPRPGMLPFAFMRDSFTIGENYEIKFGKNVTGNRGAIAPSLMPDCSRAGGANNYRDLIKGSKYGGVDACADPTVVTLDSEPGVMKGPTKNGFADRLGSDMDSFDDVLSEDPASGLTIIDKPRSPRIGIVPVIEHSDGTNDWPNGRSAPVRILAYMLVYIGKEDDPNLRATVDGTSVWMTPIRPILPADFTDGEFVDYDASLPSPVVFRLVE